MVSFIKALIFYYFDIKGYIEIKTNALEYLIEGILNQFASGISPSLLIYKTNLDQWHLVKFF